MSWFDLLKRSKLEETWRRNLEADREANQADYRKRKKVNRYARHQNRKNRCDMCGMGISRQNRHETSIDTGSTYCKRCAERRDEAATS